MYEILVHMMLMMILLSLFYKFSFTLEWSNAIHHQSIWTQV